MTPQEITERRDKIKRKLAEVFIALDNGSTYHVIENLLLDAVDEAQVLNHATDEHPWGIPLEVR